MTTTTPGLNKIQNDSSIDMNALIEANAELGFPDLTPVHKAFAYEYVASLNHRNAAVSAGMSADKGIRLLRDPLIGGMIEYLQGRVATRKIITREFIEAEMLETNDIAMGRIGTKMIDKDGEAVQVEVHNLPVARAIQTEMAKSTKFYKDGSDSSGGVTVLIKTGALGVEGEMVIEEKPKKGEIVGEFAE